MKRSFFIFIVALVPWLTVPRSHAEVPQLINYQGFLTDTLGDTVPDGNYSVTFRIYDVPVGGVPLWEEGRLVAVQGGLFAVILGSITPIPNSVFGEPNRWIGIQVGLEQENVPRFQLTSTAKRLVPSLAVIQAKATLRCRAKTRSSIFAISG